MSHTLGDSVRQTIKIHRDHMKDIPREMRVSRKGVLVMDQEESGNYIYSCVGDESGWLFLSPRVTKLTKNKIVKTTGL